MSIEGQYKRLKPLKSIAGIREATFKIYPGDEVTMKLSFESGHRLHVTVAKLNLNEIIVRIFSADGRSRVALHQFLEGNLHLIAKHLKQGNFELASKVLETQAVVTGKSKSLLKMNELSSSSPRRWNSTWLNSSSLGRVLLALNEFPGDLYLKIKECADKAMASRRLERQAAKWLAGGK